MKKLFIFGLTVVLALLAVSPAGLAAASSAIAHFQPAPATGEYDLAHLQFELPVGYHLDTGDKMLFFIDDKGQSRGWAAYDPYRSGYHFYKPNHSTLTGTETLKIPLGACTLYTLDADNGTAALGPTGTHDDYYAIVTVNHQAIYELEFSLGDKDPATKQLFIEILQKMRLKS